ncbi:transglutaminase-like domain-containing protein [Roseibacillus persicicus]|uniref:transglutaminase-like domain-containing protein n=1 Tax=Roseibacillus persicicus TaxID=454148 RepID=UPI00398A87C6
MNLYQPTHFPSPPRLLLGVSLLVWGGLTDHPLFALGAAFLVEGCHWLNWRWKFDLRGYSRAWILSLMALAGTVGFHSLNLSGPTAILAFIEWLPLIFLPLMLAQQYGEEVAVPTSVFSVIARQRLKRERKLGKVIPESRIHLGYPYFSLVLIASAFPISGNLEHMKQQWIYFGLMVVLAGIGFYYSHRSSQRRLFPWLFMLTMIGLSSMASSSGLVQLSRWVQEGGFLGSKGSRPPIEHNTAIGRLGELKLSRRIQWRVKAPEGQSPPKRLMTLAYNNYRSNSWQTYDPDFGDYERSYTDLLTIADQKDKGEFAFNTEDFEVNDQPARNQVPIRLLGAVDNNRKALPCPSSPVLFAQANEIDSIEQSQIGTILAINAANVIDVEIWTGDDPSLREAPPIQRIRNAQKLEVTALSLPSGSYHSTKERVLLEDLIQKLGLKKLSDEEKVKVLAKYFQENYRYTTHLKIADTQAKSALLQFLDTKHEGHCEYFATATTLLLRAAGVPAHYAVGFAVQEKSNRPGEYVLRGTHAHAWCRAYLGGRKETVIEERTVNVNGEEKTISMSREVWTGGRWTDVDLTPAVWLAMDSPKPNLKERIADSFQRMREDFQLWRANEKNRGWVNLTLVIIAVALAAFVIWRLSGSRVRRENAIEDDSSRPEGAPTPLTLSLPQLEKTLGQRPPGQVLSDWLQKTLPDFPKQSYRQLFQFHDRERFSKRPLMGDESREFESLVQALVETCAQRKDQ